MKTIDDVLQYLDNLVSEDTQRHLTYLEEGIPRGAWERNNYTQISKDPHCSESYVKKQAANLWKKLTYLLGVEINKDTFRSALERQYRASQRDNFGYCVQINEGNIHFGKNRDDSIEIKRYNQINLNPRMYSEFTTIAQVKEKFSLTVKELIAPEKS